MISWIWICCIQAEDCNIQEISTERPVKQSNLVHHINIFDILHICDDIGVYQANYMRPLPQEFGLMYVVPFNFDQGECALFQGMPANVYNLKEPYPLNKTLVLANSLYKAGNRTAITSEVGSMPLTAKAKGALNKGAHKVGRRIEWPDRIDETLRMTVEGNTIRFLSTNTLILRRDAHILCVWSKDQRLKFRAQIQRQESPEQIAANYIEHKLKASLDFITNKLEDDLKVQYVESGCSDLIELDNVIELSPQQDLIKKVMVLTKKIIINTNCKDESQTTHFYSKAKPRECNHRTNLGDWAIRRMAIMITSPKMLNMFQTSKYKYSKEDVCPAGKSRRTRNVLNGLAEIFGTDKSDQINRINDNTFAVQQLSKSLNALQARLQTGQNYRENMLFQLKATAQRARETEISDINVHAAFYELESFVTLLNLQLSMESAADRYTTAITHASLVLQAISEDIVEDIKNVMDKRIPADKDVKMRVEKVALILNDRIEISYTGDLLEPFTERHIECIPEDTTCIHIPAHYLHKSRLYYIMLGDLTQRTTHINCFREPTFVNCRYFAKACDADTEVGYMTNSTLTIFSMKGTTLRNMKHTPREIHIGQKTKEEHILKECFTSTHRMYCPRLTTKLVLNRHSTLTMGGEKVNMAYSHRPHSRFDLPLSITDYRWKTEIQHEMMHDFDYDPIENKSHVLATVSHILLWVAAGIIVFLVLLGCCTGTNPFRLIGKCFGPVVTPICAYAGTITGATMRCLCAKLPLNKKTNNKVKTEGNIELDDLDPHKRIKIAKATEGTPEESSPLSKIIFEESLLYGLRLLDNNTTIIEIKDKIKQGKGHDVLTHPYNSKVRLQSISYRRQDIRHDSSGDTCCVSYANDERDEILILINDRIGYCAVLGGLVKAICKDKVDLTCNKPTCIYRPYD